MSPGAAPIELLEASFRAAVAAADPRVILPRHLPAPPRGRTLVVGAGKAAASMALAVESHWPGEAPLAGLVVTRYRHAVPTQRIRVVEASHPVPDAAGEDAARQILDLVRGAGPDDLLLALISGGGSALLTLPAPGLSMNDLRHTTRELLRSGAPIQEMNVVRKHLSAIQGGRLAAACAAPMLALIISDVTGDAPTDIASGPCAPDPSTYAQALGILDSRGVETPPAVRRHLARGADREIAETPKPGDGVFVRVENRVIATAQESLQVAAALIRANGVNAVVLGDSVTGEARDAAAMHAAIVRQVIARGEPWNVPLVLLSGGECTVRLPAGSSGRGGRCSEFLLGLWHALGEGALGRVAAIACDTDGVDGSEDNAGACFDSAVIARARELGLDARGHLDRNDAYGFFEQAGGLVITGPTLTNVNDYRAILVNRDTGQRTGK